MYSENIGMPMDSYGGTTMNTISPHQNFDTTSGEGGQLSCGTTDCRSGYGYLKSQSTVSRSDPMEKYFEMCGVRNSEINRKSMPSTTPNIHHKFTKVSSEIQTMANDAYFNKMLKGAFLEIGSVLDIQDFTYLINVEVKEDIEIPEWKEIVLSVKVPKTNPDKFFQLWEMVERNVRNKIDLIEVDDESIKEKYEHFVIILDEFE